MTPRGRHLIEPGASTGSVTDDMDEVLDAIDVPVVVVTAAGMIARFNRAAAETFDLVPSDRGEDFGSLNALANAPDIEAVRLHAMSSGSASRCELQFGDRWFLVRGAPFVDSNGQISGSVLTFTNFTAFRAALGQAIHDREYTKTILNAVADPLVVLDERLRIRTANRAFYERFEISREQAYGVPLAELGDEQWRASSAWAALSATLSGTQAFQPVHLEREFPKAGRRCFLLDAQQPLKSGEVVLVLSFRDITDLKNTERALCEGEAALRENDRRKDEFLAMLAHELRNPLAPIRQAAAVSKSKVATADQKHWSHEVIDRQVNHMALLLDDLLDVSRITRGTLELRLQMTDLASVIAMASETARPVIEAKRHAFKIEIESGPAHFAADPLRLAQVLSNLLVNAAKYTEPEGEIRLRAASAAESVTFSVVDNGIGIAVEAQKDVFAMFSQIRTVQHHSDGGLGIGLALADGLVRLHGGTLAVNSEGVGHGCEFVVTLPRRRLSDPAEPKAATESTVPIPRRILVADDNRDAADSLAMLLRMQGHEVVVVHDGVQAVANCGSFQPDFAVLDIGMPEMDGYEVARQVRFALNGARITLIAVTGWGQNSDKIRAVAAGFDYHFTKPIDVDGLTRLFAGSS